MACLSHIQFLLWGKDFNWAKGKALSAQRSGCSIHSFNVQWVNSFLVVKICHYLLNISLILNLKEYNFSKVLYPKGCHSGFDLVPEMHKHENKWSSLAFHGASIHPSYLVTRLSRYYANHIDRWVSQMISLPSIIVWRVLLFIWPSWLYK